MALSISACIAPDSPGDMLKICWTVWPCISFLVPAAEVIEPVLLPMFNISGPFSPTKTRPLACPPLARLDWYSWPCILAIWIAATAPIDTAKAGPNIGPPSANALMAANEAAIAACALARFLYSWN